MCQVTPFTLPCCRRIYVSVEKLPSCPDDWPRKKCPKELIVQISGYEPKDVQHRDRGICWRCLADKTGKRAWERESLRPVLDRAFIVEGLEEWNMDERRVRVEKAGLCWFCGGDRGCGTCGSGKTQAIAEQNAAQAGIKRGRGEADMGKGKGTNKRSKVGHAGSSISPPPSITPSRFFEQQTLDPTLQRYDYTARGYGGESSYDQFAQPAPAFILQLPELQFQAPMPQYSSVNGQDAQGYQNHRMFTERQGGVQVDPLLYQQQEKQQVQQKFDLSVRQQQELPPIPDFRENAVDLDVYQDIDEETMNRLLAEYDKELLKTDDEDKKNTTKVPAASQTDPSLESTQYQYPSPT